MLTIRCLSSSLLLLYMLYSMCLAFQPSLMETRRPHQASSEVVSLCLAFQPSLMETRRLHHQAASQIDNAIPSDSFEHANTSSVTVEYLSKEPPLLRAMEIGGVVVGELLGPIVSSLIFDGIPNNWEDFWLKSSGKFTNAERATRALEALGPTYVKFGQALASRPDVIPTVLADALATLQDDMRPFRTEVAKAIIRADLNTTLDEAELDAFLGSFTDEVVAAASVGQVFKARYRNVPVAVKVQRPGIRKVVERDAALLRSVAEWIESLSSPSGGKLVATKLVDAVNEFMSRIFEELDYRNEAANIATFASLYSYQGGSCEKVKVVVPEVIPDLCSDDIIVMTWLEGTKLTSGVNGTLNEKERAENLRLIETGIDCTLSQLLDTGVMHADPHAGNLIKTMTEEGNRLGYLDFGLLSTVPSRVRDGLVCAVAQLVFAKDVEAVANLFGELSLLPEEVLLDPVERAALTEALEKTLAEALIYPPEDASHNDYATQIPKLKFDKLLDALSRLVPRFQFELPPYFINNARALSTLEGIARSLNPSFNVLQVMYPYCLNRLITNPTQSPIVDDTLQSLIRSPETGRVDRARVSKLLSDSALLTGFRQRRVLWDILSTRAGRKLTWQITLEKARDYLSFGRMRSLCRGGTNTQAKKRFRFLQL